MEIKPAVSPSTIPTPDTPVSETVSTPEPTPVADVAATSPELPLTHGAPNLNDLLNNANNAGFDEGALQEVDFTSML